MSAHKEQALLCNSVVLSNAIILSLNCFSLPNKKGKHHCFQAYGEKIIVCIMKKKSHIHEFALSGLLIIIILIKKNAGS